MANVPEEFDAFPNPAPQRGDRQTFAKRLDACITWFATQMSKVGAACVSAYQNAVAAAASASAAAAAAEAATYTSGATQWVSGTTYAKGAVAWSPATGRSYRRLTAGAGTVDPSLDRVNWAGLSYESTVLATATISAAVANVDFLNIFSSEFDKYTIELQGLVKSVSGQTSMVQLAFGGVVATSGYSADYAGGSGGTTSSGLPIIINLQFTGTVEIRNANGSYKSLGSRGFDGSFRYYEAGISVAGAASGFRIIAGSGTITAGTIRIFGHRNI